MPQKLIFAKYFNLRGYHLLILMFFFPSSDAVLSSFETTMTKVQEYMSKYFKYAPERVGGGGRKK